MRLYLWVWLTFGVQAVLIYSSVVVQQCEVSLPRLTTVYNHWTGLGSGNAQLQHPSFHTDLNRMFTLCFHDVQIPRTLAHFVMSAWELKFIGYSTYL